MQTASTPRPEPRRQTPAYAGGAVNFPGNNERQLLARIAQLEAMQRDLHATLDYIQRAYHPDAAEYMPELRGISESQFDALIVGKVDDALACFQPHPIGGGVS